MQDQPDSYDEDFLVHQLSNSNLLSFNTLFNRYSNGLYRFAYGYLKSESEAEELVQEVFAKIWEKRADLKEELSFKSYIFTIAFNLIRKHFRTKSHLLEYFNSRDNTDCDNHTVQDITYESLNSYIKELVNKLPERRKAIFIKSRFEGLSISEISEELSISHKTVENQLTDALRYIRKNLSKEGITASLFFFLFFS